MGISTLIVLTHQKNKNSTLNSGGIVIYNAFIFALEHAISDQKLKLLALKCLAYWV